MASQVLTRAQEEQFIETGWCAVEDCFDPRLAREWCDRWIEEQGYDPAAPDRWGVTIQHQRLKEGRAAKEVSPKAYAAAEDVVGTGRIENWWWQGFIVNVGLRRDRPWAMPGIDEGWHVDGDFFHHFLDSREQGLLSIQVFSDVEPRGGATVVSEDSYPPIARMLRDRPEGLSPGAVVSEAKKVVPFGRQRELCAKAGTVVLCHPLVLHASSPNTDGPPRFMMNAVPILKDHFRFDDLERASLVERATIHACGGRPFAFTAAGERRRYTPNRGTYTKKS